MTHLENNLLFTSNIISNPPEVSWEFFASKKIRQAVEHVLNENGSCNFFLTAGNTAKLLYRDSNFKKLATNKNIFFFLGDERCVDHNHPDSNYRMILNELIENDQPEAINIQKVNPYNLEWNLAAKKYNSTIPNQIDIVILSVGMDGHIASIFPHFKKELFEGKSACLIEANVEIKNRITITPEAILRAKNVFLLAKGAEKGRILADAILDWSNSNQYPVSILFNNCHWLLDQEANSELRSRVNCDSFFTSTKNK